MKTPLTPHLAQVYQWRTEGKTWREIEALLLSEKGLKTSYSQVRRWYKNQCKKGIELQKEHEALKFLLASRGQLPVERPSAPEPAQIPIKKPVEPKSESKPESSPQGEEQNDQDALEAMSDEELMAQVERDYYASIDKNKPRLKRF